MFSWFVFVLGLLQVYVLGLSRCGDFISNPIHFGGFVLLNSSSTATLSYFYIINIKFQDKGLIFFFFYLNCPDYIN
jgi:hypothetical protein